MKGEGGAKKPVVKTVTDSSVELKAKNVSNLILSSKAIPKTVKTTEMSVFTLFKKDSHSIAY